jgi:hypothetical protein
MCVGAGLAAATTIAGELSVDTLTVNQQGNFYGAVSVTPYPSGSIPTNDLVLRYSFSTNTTPVADLSGNNHTGVVYGAAWTSDGVKGGGYWFDGVNDYIRVPKTSMLNITGQLTVAFWMKRDASTENMTPISKHDTGDATPNVYWSTFLLPGGTFRFYVNGSQQDTVTLVADGWKHIVIVHQNTTDWIYEDGALVTSADGYSIPSNNKDVLIGRRCDGYYFKGTIDEVLIYKRALSTSDVQNLYYATGTFTNSQSGTVTVSNTLTVANGIIQNNPQGTNVFAGKLRLNSGIQYLAPGSDISMGAYTNAP